MAPKKRIADKVFINRMFEYSARKKRAKGPPAYSTLKPETSSDSPSVKSNGARLVSANVETYHIAAKGHPGANNQIASWAVLNIVRLNPPTIIITDSRISPRLTSYEMVWATARSAPIRAYFEFDAHPDPRIEYTARLERASTNRMPRLRLITGYGIGMGAHIVRARVRARVGVTKNRNGEAVDGRMGSLINNFTPSAIGCNKP